jgi:uncharacterized alpha-E superfamily protein
MLRVLRAYVIRAAEGSLSRGPLHEELQRAMVALGVIPLERAGGSALEVAREALDWPGSALSIGNTAQRAFDAAGRIRDRFAPDAWRALRELTTTLSDAPGANVTEMEIVDRISATLRILSAFSGLVQENMTRLAGWRFLEVGRRLERAIGTTRLVQRFAVRAERSDRGTSAAESLDALLEITDSVISYRQRYSITATRSSVVDLVALDPNNPRALAFQASRLVEHLQALSDQSPEEVPAEPLSQAILLSAQLCAARASQLDESRFADFDAALLSLSDAIARTYLVDRTRLARPIAPM